MNRAGPFIARARCVVALAIVAWMLLVAMAPAQAQAAPHGLIDEAVWSPGLQEWRRVIVRLPDGYGQSLQHYPVVYLLDGEDHVDHASGVTGFLAKNHRMPQVIVVAVANIAGVGKRDRDLTPASVVPDEARLGGGADRFLGFLADELAPWVNRRFRSNDFRILIGHSYGGLFALHTLATRPDAFQAHLALDPSLWYGRESLLRELPPVLSKLKGDRFRFLYTAGIATNTALEKFVQAIGEAPPRGITLRSRPVHAGEDHNSMVHLAIYDGLEQLFAGWNHADAIAAALDAGRDPLLAVQAHYAGLQKKYGFATVPPVKAYLWAAYSHLPLPGEDKPRRPGRALEILREMHGLYPETFHNLAAALEQAGRPDEARRVLREGMRYFAVRSDASMQMMRLDEQLEALKQPSPERKHAH